MGNPWAMMGFRPGDRLLDVGFRNVEELRALAGQVGPSGQVVGIDLSVARVEEAVAAVSGSESERITVARGSVLRIPFDDAAFDVVFCKGVLHEVRRVDAAVAEMARVCRPGGAVCVVDITRIARIRFEGYRWRAWLRGRRTGDVWPGFSRARIERAARAAGLEVDRYEVLPTTWRLGNLQIEPFLMRARRFDEP
jgi:ubiquinone/menaquinone biosynthesis C-methylase UbiE